MADKDLTKFTKKGKVRKRPRRVPGMSDDAMRNFIRENVVITSSGCWEWKLTKTGGGYGSMWLSGVGSLAHRAAFVLFRGPIPAGACVCHHCDNPPCCNPDHLWLGSRSENMSDMVKKGRFVGYDRAAHNNPNAKLTALNVAEIRSLLDEKRTFDDIANMFGVSNSAIQKIKYGKTWSAKNEN